MTPRLELIAAEMREKYSSQKTHGKAGARHTYSTGCRCFICKSVKRANQNSNRQTHRLLASYRKTA